MRAVLRAECAPEHAAVQKRPRGVFFAFGSAFTFARLGSPLLRDGDPGHDGRFEPACSSLLRAHERRELPRVAHQHRARAPHERNPRRRLGGLRGFVENQHVERREFLNILRARARRGGQHHVRVRQNLALGFGAGLAARTRHLLLLEAQTREFRVERSPLARARVVTRREALAGRALPDAPPELVPLLPAAPRRVHELAAPRAPGLVEVPRGRVAHARLERILHRGVGDALGRTDAHKGDAFRVSVVAVVVSPRRARARLLRQALHQIIHRRVGRRARQDTGPRSDGAANDLDHHLGLPSPGRALDPAHGRGAAQRRAHRQGLRVVESRWERSGPALRRGAHVQRGQVVRSERAERRPVCVLFLAGGFRAERRAESLGDVRRCREVPGERVRVFCVLLVRRRRVRRGTPRGGKERADDARRGGIRAARRHVPQRAERGDLPLVRGRVGDAHQAHQAAAHHLLQALPPGERLADALGRLRRVLSRRLQESEHAVRGVHLGDHSLGVAQGPRRLEGVHVAAQRARARVVVVAVVHEDGGHAVADRQRAGGQRASAFDAQVEQSSAFHRSGPRGCESQSVHHRARATDDRALADVAIDSRLRTRHRRRRRGFRLPLRLERRCGDVDVPRDVVLERALGSVAPPAVIVETETFAVAFRRIARARLSFAARFPFRRRSGNV